MASKRAQVQQGSSRSVTENKSPGMGKRRDETGVQEIQDSKTPRLSQGRQHEETKRPTLKCGGHAPRCSAALASSEPTSVSDGTGQANREGSSGWCLLNLFLLLRPFLIPASFMELHLGEGAISRLRFGKGPDPNTKSGPSFPHHPSPRLSLSHPSLHSTASPLYHTCIMPAHRHFLSSDDQPSVRSPIASFPLLPHLARPLVPAPRGHGLTKRNLAAK